ncbi:MAG: glycosyltransferase family 2 protein [Candidatus Omnitrophica bacterium]|nr:glycosyltransferase family 2 protein [Candidatus Omnitrophota bacterium]
MHKLSILVHTYNNELIIKRCLESVKWADEVVICDSFSTDKTIDTCKEYTKKIYQYAHKNSADQKNWAIPKCTYKWIFQIDTDEVATEELALEIKQILSQEAISENAFRVPTKNYIFGKWVKSAGLYPGNRIRLFKNIFRYEDKYIHAQLIVDAKIGQLQNHVLHYGFQDWKTVRWKFKRYRRLELLQLKKENAHVMLYDLLIKPISIFIYLYFLKAGFRDGWRGLFWPYFVSILKFCVYKDMLHKK